MSRSKGGDLDVSLDTRICFGDWRILRNPASLRPHTRNEQLHDATLSLTPRGGLRALPITQEIPMDRPTLIEMIRAFYGKKAL